MYLNKTSINCVRLGGGREVRGRLSDDHTGLGLTHSCFAIYVFE
jgi:hypothetical protein